ncbi:PIN domain-like protein [Macrolepiota fuliginosa MF-IS2]|uniref:PIN domain-like protein n=1 Tax=Macrolepiota fuliginosa MF-IS2 TaxID=1400762 RepID=A0A9P5XJ52_9AGAR|nr:PIN domain-like protein [Macrolepiota fuliginosa MF-IS2]
MGVKSLWTLLTPVGRPILLETVEGKTMAIDSSIWIYQFQATMRDKEGRGLLNAHVLGFLRRITKLLFYGIKPVFVFDGGAPALKRSTLNERKKKKSGAALSHVKIAERLLAAQLRREALNHAQNKKPSKGKGKEKARAPDDIILDENTVYLEDIDSSAPKTPARTKPRTPPSSTKKKDKYHDHDPYRLPEVDIDEVVAKATRTNIPDPRLATEDELRTFIEEMRPEDFDVTSPEFRELPTEVQYEIIGDLRLKSRQTSHARLLKMLRMAPTPMDFSKQQIVNLKQRNSLTQQLLITTDSIGTSHLSIPVRIANERNREYVLTKNEGADGGWVLAIQDKAGTAPEKPILIDVEEEKVEEDEEDEDADMEEVDTTNTTNIMDPDLREYQREMALSAIAGRYTPKKLAPLTSRPIRRKNSNPLFSLDAEDEDEETAAIRQAMEQFEDDEDEELAFALQESLDHTKTTEQRRNSYLSPTKTSPPKPPQESPRSVGSPNAWRSSSNTNILTPSGLETALAFAGTTPSRKVLSRNMSGPQEKSKSAFGTPSLLSRSRSTSSNMVPKVGGHILGREATRGEEQPMPSTTSSSMIAGFQALTDSEDDGMEEVDVVASTPVVAVPIKSHVEDKYNKPSNALPLSQSESEDQDMEEVEVAIPKPTVPVEGFAIPPSRSPSSGVLSPSPKPGTQTQASISGTTIEIENIPTVSPPSTPDKRAKTPLFAWSRTPSPAQIDTTSMSFGEPSSAIAALTMTNIISHELDHEGEQEITGNEYAEEEHWDAAHEMDPHAEEGEFARFLSQVKGRDLGDVRKEIDDEIKVLNDQRKAALRDSEDITQQMISQIMTMLRLFGIPYITAPMEAEAQCAELVSLGLVDGVITDDSDVFLFGAQRVYKNMFNQSKTVELFLSSDLERELGLDRDTLVMLAYLLGSDYTEGLGGVGPVVAMELLKEFPGKDGLHKFADWWRKVQEGKDKEGESNTKFRRQFKKKFKDLYLPTDWPLPVVRDAYYHPTVDSSDEPFKWGLPDLDALRMFFNQELGWGQTKVDELLLPIIQKMNRRRTNASGTASGMQGNLSEWVSAHAVNNNSTANLAPRKKEVYTSRRLQQVVADFRKRRKAGSVGPGRSGSAISSEDEGEKSADEPLKKRQKKTKSNAPRGSAGRGRRRGNRAIGGRKGKGKKDDADYTEGSAEDEEGGEDGVDAQDTILNTELRPRPRPRPVRSRKPAAETDNMNAAQIGEGS